VGAGRGLSVLDVANVLLTLYGSKLAPVVAHKFRAGDVRHCFADISKARRLLGYEPKVAFEEGMKELVEWGRKVEAKDGFERAYEELRNKGLVEG
ncbi:MAG TPA: nucleoside-diphosphate sugar epimerase, partial [Thermoplasmata archaeon]|nr:nucleoside-diphosphate sugar epimerase [Thermoplasmata archaeon]